MVSLDEDDAISTRACAETRRMSDNMDTRQTRDVPSPPHGPVSDQNGKEAVSG